MYENVIKHYPDFPIPGIDFIDIMPFLQNKEVFNSLVKDIDAVVSAPNVVTAEARGFLFAAPLLTLEGDCMDASIDPCSTVTKIASFVEALNLKKFGNIFGKMA